jgi:hypothetical protein
MLYDGISGKSFQVVTNSGGRFYWKVASAIASIRIGGFMGIEDVLIKVVAERRQKVNLVKIIQRDLVGIGNNNLASGYVFDLVKKFCCFDKNDRSLYMDLRGFEGDHIHIGAWEKGLATQYWNPNHGWIDQELDFCFPLLACRESNAGAFPGSSAKNRSDQETYFNDLELFSQTIPAQVCEAVSPFGVCQLLLLRTLHECPAHLALVKENPTLVFLAGLKIYENDCSSAEKTTEFIKLLYLKRRCIAEYALGHNSEKTVHLLSKLRFDRYDCLETGNITNFLGKSELCDMLAAYRYIPEFFFSELVSNPAIIKMHVFSPKGEVVEKGFDRKTFDDALQTCRDCIRIGECMGQDVLRRTAECRTVSGLERLHNRLVEEMHQVTERELERKNQEMWSIPFPEPPFSGNGNISPVTTAIELYREGKAMHHCVATYCDTVFRGESFFYRIISPERATMEIVRCGKDWQVGRIKLICNADPSEKTWTAAKRWLEERKREGKDNVGKK